jgi:hypothetical protein
MPSPSVRNHVRNQNHVRSTSGAPTQAISQSSTATGVKSRYIMFEMRASPHVRHGGPRSVGFFAFSHANVSSRSGCSVPAFAHGRYSA